MVVNNGENLASVRAKINNAIKTAGTVAGDISTLQGDVAAIRADVSVNKDDIAANAANIVTNAADITAIEANLAARGDVIAKTSAQWTSDATVLGPNEIGIETDTGRVKFGDGVTAWNSLPYRDTVFGERNAANAAAAASLPDGVIVAMGGLQYRVDSTATGIASATNDLGVDGLIAFETKDGLKPAMAYGLAADGVTDDTAVLLRIAAGLSNGEGVIFPAQKIFFNGAITFNQNNLTVKFDGTEFLIGDTGANATLISTATGKVGLHFKGCADLQVIGSARCIGQGAKGSTSLAGMVFDECANANVSASIYYENMAAGRFVLNCDFGKFADCTAKDMDGLQTFQSPPTDNAGTGEVVAGCQYSVFGSVTSEDTEKPARYLSIQSDQRQTQNCTFGASISKNLAGSLTSSALSIRNALDCSFGLVSATGPHAGLFVVGYSGDTVKIDRLDIAAVSGATTSSGASVDALAKFESGGNDLGSIYIGSINGEAGGEFALSVTSGKVTCGKVNLSGSASRLAVVYAGAAGHRPDLNVGVLSVGNFTSAQNPIQVGKGGCLNVDRLDLHTGPTAAVSIAVTYNSAFGDASYTHHRGISINTARYAQNGSANNYAFLVNDADATYAGPLSVRLGHVEKSDNSAAHLRLAGFDFYPINGILYTDAPPTSGAWPRGMSLMRRTASLTTMGWVQRSGTPTSPVWANMATLT